MPESNRKHFEERFAFRKFEKMKSTGRSRSLNNILEVTDRTMVGYYERQERRLHPVTHGNYLHLYMHNCACM